MIGRWERDPHPGPDPRLARAVAVFAMLLLIGALIAVTAADPLNLGPWLLEDRR